MIEEAISGNGLPSRLVFHDRLVAAISNFEAAGVLQVQHQPDAPFPRGRYVAAQVESDQSVLLIAGSDIEAKARAICEDSCVRAAGLAIFPDSEEHPDSLMTAAAEALTASSKQGGGLVKSPARRGLGNSGVGFGGGRPAIRFQPKLDLKHGGLAGVELLLRVGDGSGGRQPFDESVTRGLDPATLSRVTAQTLETALTECRAWAAAGFRAFSLALNVSLGQFAEGRLTAMLDDFLRLRPSDAWPLVLEITEANPPKNLDRLLPHLHAARALGLELSLDDLGSGYASLDLLSRLPLDEVKIDRSYINPPFVADDWEEGLRSIVDLAHAAGLSVVAEGVESGTQIEALSRIGCDSCQGYLISPPLEADALKCWILAGAGAIPGIKPNG